MSEILIGTRTESTLLCKGVWTRVLQCVVVVLDGQVQYPDAGAFEPHIGDAPTGIAKAVHPKPRDWSNPMFDPIDDLGRYRFEARANHRIANGHFRSISSLKQRCVACHLASAFQ
jgi:hypothetical protein